MSKRKRRPAQPSHDLTDDDFVAPSRKPQAGGWVVPCLLIFGVFVLMTFLVGGRPAGGFLLALATIGGAITLLAKREWQDKAFGPLGVNAPVKRYVVLGVTIMFMLLTFITTDAEQADALWAEGKKSEAVELYVAELERPTAIDPQSLTRVIEYYFEKGDMERTKHFCNMAVDAEVELSLDPQELRDLYAMIKADHTREIEEAKATELAKQEAEQAKEELDVERETRKRLDKFVAVLKESGVTVVSHVTVRDTSLGSNDSMWEAKIEVQNLWHLKAYQIRLQDAQTLWETWAKIASPMKVDSARISIVDLNGNEVGGSRVFAGSLIWVQEN